MSHIKFNPVSERKHVNRFTEDGENIIKWVVVRRKQLRSISGVTT